MLMTIDHAGDVPQQIESVKAAGVKGMLLFALEMLPEDLTPFLQMELPLVALDNHFGRLPVNTVSIDNEMGTYQALEYLASLGHRQIGYLQSDIAVSSFLERAAGYLSAAADLGLELVPFSIPYTEAGSYLAFRSILEDHPVLPSAFVSDDDTMASGVMRALAEAGYSIPGDVSIIGFNDRPSCELTVPPLTSINVPRTSFGAEGVDALVKLIRRTEKKSAMMRPLKLRIGTQLVVRGSVGKYGGQTVPSE